MLEQNNPSIFTQEVDGLITVHDNVNFSWLALFFQIESETVQARQILGDIEARHKDLLKLELSILELNSLYNDMAVLVNNQVFASPSF